MIWHILGILAFVVIYNIYRYYHEDNSYEYSPVTTSTSDNNQVSFFKTARTLDIEIEKCRLQECER